MFAKLYSQHTMHTCNSENGLPEFILCQSDWIAIYIHVATNFPLQVTLQKKTVHCIPLYQSRAVQSSSFHRLWHSSQFKFRLTSSSYGLTVQYSNQDEGHCCRCSLLFPPYCDFCSRFTAWLCKRCPNSRSGRLHWKHSWCFNSWWCSQCL